MNKCWRAPSTLNQSAVVQESSSEHDVRGATEYRINRLGRGKTKSCWTDKQELCIANSSELDILARVSCGILRNNDVGLGTKIEKRHVVKKAQGNVAN